MLRTILSISGRPGLFKLVTQGNNMLIVEEITPAKRRMPAYAADRIISLGDIAIYTLEGEAPLAEVFDAIKDKYEAKAVDINTRKAPADELYDFMDVVLPEFDRDRVYISDIKKLINWYNILVNNGITEFSAEEETNAEESEEDKEEE